MDEEIIDFGQLSVNLRRTIYRIKVMLWAGDYIWAREELARINNEHGRQIRKALSLRESTIRNEIKVRHNARGQLALKGYSTVEVKRRAAEEAARSSHNMTAGSAGLFVISALVGVISKLDHRIATEIKQKPLFHDRKRIARPDLGEQIEPQPVYASEDPYSGFRYVEILRDANQWEWRAYRFGGESVSLAIIMEVLKQRRGFIIDLLDWVDEEHEDDLIWPLRFRGFSISGFFEVVILDFNRLLIKMTGVTGTDQHEFLKIVFSAFGER